MQFRHGIFHAVRQQRRNVIVTEASQGLSLRRREFCYFCTGVTRGSRHMPSTLHRSVAC